MEIDGEGMVAPRALYRHADLDGCRQLKAAAEFHVQRQRASDEWRESLSHKSSSFDLPITGQEELLPLRCGR